LENESGRKTSLSHAFSEKKLPRATLDTSPQFPTGEKNLASSPNLAFKELQSLKAAYDEKMGQKSPRVATGSFGPLN